MFYSLSRKALVIGCLLMTSFAQADESTESRQQNPFFLPTPDGWRSETIPLPLDFAPELHYTGLEELRFSPGMFDASSELFWTYLFIWWVPEDTSITAKQLSVDMEHYFSGLSHAVLAEQDFKVDESVFDAKFVKHGNNLTGKVDTLDPFVTKQTISLNVQVNETACVEQGRKAVFFKLSPQPTNHEAWNKMGSIRQGFLCTNKQQESQ